LLFGVFHVKHYQKILSITINCAIFILVVGPAGWLLNREWRAVENALGVSREVKVWNLTDRAGKILDPWQKWKYCREILTLEPENTWALFQKSRIANEYARKARELMQEGRTREAIPTLVLAVRVDPQVGYHGVWLEDWIKAWAEENRAPRPETRSSAGNHK